MAKLVSLIVSLLGTLTFLLNHHKQSDHCIYSYVRDVMLMKKGLLLDAITCMS